MRAGFVTNPKASAGLIFARTIKLQGKDAGAVFMPAGQTGVPMTYPMVNGKQYIVYVAVGGALDSPRSCWLTGYPD